MRYQSTTGLAREGLTEVVARVHEILESRGESLKAHALGLFRQVEVALTLLAEQPVPGTHGRPVAYS